MGRVGLFNIASPIAKNHPDLQRFLRLLASRAIKRRTLPLTQAFNRAGTHPAWQASTVINHGVKLKLAGLPVCI